MTTVGRPASRSGPRNVGQWRTSASAVARLLGESQAVPARDPAAARRASARTIRAPATRAAELDQLDVAARLQRVAQARSRGAQCPRASAPGRRRRRRPSAPATGRAPCDARTSRAHPQAWRVRRRGAPVARRARGRACSCAPPRGAQRGRPAAARAARAGCASSSRPTSRPAAPPLEAPPLCVARASSATVSGTPERAGAQAPVDVLVVEEELLVERPDPSPTHRARCTGTRR